MAQQGRVDRIHFTVTDFSPLQSIFSGCGAHSSSCAVDSEGCLPWNKKTGTWNWLPTSIYSKTQNAWRYTTSPHMPSWNFPLIKCSDNCTFYYTVMWHILKHTNIVRKRLYWKSYSFSHSIVCQQVYSVFQSKFSTQCDLVLPLSISNILSFP